LVLDGLLISGYADIDCGALMHDSPQCCRHHGEKAPLKDNDFLALVSQGFLYTARSQYPDDMQPGPIPTLGSYRIPRLGYGSGDAPKTQRRPRRRSRWLWRGDGAASGFRRLRAPNRTPARGPRSDRPSALAESRTCSGV
jgi:hypothetical protein